MIKTKVIWNSLIQIILVIIVALMLSPKGYTQGKPVSLFKDLEVVQFSDHVYIYISYIDLETSKHVPANGLIYVNGDEAILIDTPWTNELTTPLVHWIRDTLGVNLKGIVATHWHHDCMGGLAEIHKMGIRSYSHHVTAEIAFTKNLPVPQTTFTDSLVIEIGDGEVQCHFLGGGHTPDNIVLWIPSEKLLYGGCMIKPLNWSSLGNVTDADLHAYPSTLKKLRLKFSQCETVFPGHGAHGGLELISHTLKLFEKAHSN